MWIRGCKLRNFGDTLNTELVRLICGSTPSIVNSSFKNPKKETLYMVIGSVLGWVDEYTEVWGAGFISNSQFITSIPKPKKIHAVRGKETRKILLKKGIECPEVYGDPALLMPKFYNPKLEKKYKLSIIPHHIDKVLIPKLKQQFPEAHFIDIQEDIYKFIDEVLHSEMIITSSLHGQILADAYNIPNAWILLSQKVLGKGFKMRDYYSSVNREDKEALIWTKELTIKNLIDKINKWNSPKIDLNKLWDACPFRRFNYDN